MFLLAKFYTLESLKVAHCCRKNVGIFYVAYDFWAFYVHLLVTVTTQIFKVRASYLKR
jgi:hypothetical protein